MTVKNKHTKHTKISKKQLWEFVDKQPIITMATVSAKGEPRCTPMLFVLTKQWTMYMITRKQTSKYKNIQKTQKVGLSVWSKGELAAQFSATAVEVTDTKESDKAQDLLATKGAAVEDFWPPVIRMQAGEYAVIKLHLTEARCIDLSYDAISEPDSLMQYFQLA